MAHKRKDGDHFDDLEQAVNDALRQAFGRAECLHIWGETAHVKQFGSQVYNLATSTSSSNALSLPSTPLLHRKVYRKLHNWSMPRGEKPSPGAPRTINSESLAWKTIGNSDVIQRAFRGIRYQIWEFKFSVDARTHVFLSSGKQEVPASNPLIILISNFTWAESTQART